MSQALARPLDTLYTVETPEGIELTLRPAGVVARSLAYAIDFLIRAAIYFGVAMVVSPFKGIGQAVIIILMFALEWFYPVVFELSRRGATPGKRALGLRVVMDNGLPVTPSASFTRNLLRAADFMPFMYGFGLLSLLMRTDFKRLGDLAAGTLVVYDRHITLHGTWPEADPLAPRRPLSVREQAAVLAWAGRTERLTPERLEELAELASPVLGDDVRASGARVHHPWTRALLGVAQWTLGRRTPGGRP